MSLAEEVGQMNEHEKAILRRRWGMNDAGEIQEDQPEPKRGVYMTIFFPKDSKFEAFSLYGQVPQNGDKISFRNLSIRNSLEGYDFSEDFLRDWYVKKVWHVVTVQGTKKDQLLHDHKISVEVHVDYRRFKFWRENFSRKYYYAPRRKLLDKVRSIRKSIAARFARKK